MLLEDSLRINVPKYNVTEKKEDSSKEFLSDFSGSLSLFEDGIKCLLASSVGMEGTLLSTMINVLGLIKDKFEVISFIHDHRATPKALMDSKFSVGDYFSVKAIKKAFCAFQDEFENYIEPFFSKQQLQQLILDPLKKSNKLYQHGKLYASTYKYMQDKTGDSPIKHHLMIISCVQSIVFTLMNVIPEKLVMVGFKFLCSLSLFSAKKYEKVLKRSLSQKVNIDFIPLHRNIKTTLNKA